MNNNETNTKKQKIRRQKQIRRQITGPKGPKTSNIERITKKITQQSIELKITNDNKCKPELSIIGDFNITKLNFMKPLEKKLAENTNMLLREYCLKFQRQ